MDCRFNVNGFIALIICVVRMRAFAVDACRANLHYVLYEDREWDKNNNARGGIEIPVFAGNLNLTSCITPFDTRSSVLVLVLYSLFYDGSNYSTCLCIGYETDNARCLILTHIHEYQNS